MRNLLCFELRLCEWPIVTDKNPLFIICYSTVRHCKAHYSAPLSTVIQLGVRRSRVVTFAAIGLQCLGFKPMFPLSCARVRAHTGCETSAHKKTWRANKIF